MARKSTDVGVHLLAYVDDIDTIGHIKPNATAAFSAIKRKSGDIKLENKTKYLLSTSGALAYWTVD